MKETLEKILKGATYLPRKIYAATFLVPLAFLPAACGDDYKKAEIYNTPPALVMAEDSNAYDAFNIHDYLKGSFKLGDVVFEFNNVGCEMDNDGNAQCYTKTPDWYGAETGKLRVTGERGETAEADMTVEVTPVNDAPNLLSINTVGPSGDGKIYLGNLSAGEAISFALAGSDIDGDSLIYRLYDSQGNELNLAENYRFNEGTHTLTAEVDDGNGGVSSLEAILTVSEGTPPSFTNLPESSTATEGSAYSLDLNAEDSYGIADLTYSLLSAPEGMTVDENTGQLSWENPVAGDYTVTLKVDNGYGGVNTENLDLAVYNSLPDYFDDAFDDDIDPSEEYGMKLSISVWENVFRQQLGLEATPFGYNLQNVYLDVSYDPIADKFIANSGNILQRLSTTNSLQVDKEGNNNGTIDGLIIVDKVLMQSVVDANYN